MTIIISILTFLFAFIFCYYVLCFTLVWVYFSKSLIYKKIRDENGRIIKYIARSEWWDENKNDFITYEYQLTRSDICEVKRAIFFMFVVGGCVDDHLSERLSKIIMGTHKNKKEFYTEIKSN